MYDRGSPYAAWPIGPNPKHPLNQGARGWWLNAPDWSGGAGWYEQFRQVFNNLGATFPARAWGGSTQRWGCLTFDGSTTLIGLDAAQYGVVSNLVWTWAAFVQTTSAVTNATFIGEGQFASGTPLFQFASDQGAGSFAGLVWRGNSGTTVTQAGTVAINDGAWHQVVGTSDGTTMSLYVDGKLDTTSVVSGVGATTLDRCSIGCLRRSTNSNFWAGSLDDIRCYNRCLSAREVNALYLESLAGYPEALLYYRPRQAWLVPGPTTSTGSGAITLGPLAAAGSASFSTPASGAVTLGALVPAGVGIFKASASGAITLGALAASAVATFTATASGAVVLGGLSASGAASFATSATGAVTLGALAASGVGTASSPGTSTGAGTITLGAVAAAGAGTFRASASGAVSLGPLAVAGVGVYTAAAAGSVALAGIAAAGVGTFTATAAGGITLRPLAASGSATGGAAVVLGAYPDPFGASSAPAGPDPFAATATAAAPRPDPFGASSRFKGS